MEHVRDISDPPIVEFLSVQMEFHESGPTRPAGPIVFDLDTKDADGNPKQTDLKVMESSIARLAVKFRVLNNAVIGLKVVTGVKGLGAVFKEEEVFGAYRADPNTIIEEHTPWIEQPSGFLARRGHYQGKLYFSDVQKNVHLQLDVKLKISKNW